jgi:DNA-binding transcriptional LysR family regulator
MIDELRSLVTVMDEVSLTRAAEKLCVTQSAVSKRVQRLESVLGAELLDRNSKPPRATALAHRIHEHAVPLLAAFDRLMNVAKEEGEPSGRLRFGLPQAVADVILMDALMGMKSAFPQLDVSLQSDWSPNLIRLLKAGQLDVAAIMRPKGKAPSDEFAHRYIATLDVVVVQSGKRPVVPPRAKLAEVAAQEWILNPEGCGYRAAIQHTLGAAGHALKVRAETHGSEMQLQLIAAGLGLGLIPATLLAQSDWKRRLDIVKVERFAPKLDVWLMFPQQLGNLQRAVNLLGDTVAESFSQ